MKIGGSGGGGGYVRIDEDRLWVNEARTILVRMWASGTVEVATREDSSATWGPPILMTEES